jgi:hypothetical protein
MVTPNPGRPETGEKVQIPVAVAVIQVGALGSLIHLVETDRVQHPRQLRIEILGVQLIA